MKNKKIVNIIFIPLIILAAAVSAFYYYKNNIAKRLPLPNPENAFVPGAKDDLELDHVLINVPFTSQAPLGHWDDPRQEDGCEEASILMSWLWINHSTMSAQQAENAIIEISDFEQATYGNYHDFNAEDTAKLIEDYYHYDKLDVRINPSIEDIKIALKRGFLVLVPSNGQLLNNPHYKQPGPTTHMLVIKGFDDRKKEFITNDPGTRYGEGYTYSYNVLYNAMIDYPSGNHGSQVGRPKAMIIVEK